MENTIIVAVKGIIVHNNKVLIVQRSADDDFGANTWEYVGGGIEFGEGLEDALIREAKEEAGLQVTVDKLLYAVSFNTSEQRQLVILTYLCTANDNIVTLSKEHKDYLWADKNQMMDLLSKPIIDNLSHYSVWDYIFVK